METQRMRLDMERPRPEGMNSLIVELEHYRRQSEWLSCVNDLHTRLAGAVDLPAMIEAFSVWLMPLVEHDLIAYNNPVRKRVHLYCSCHGPDRRKVIEAAESMFEAVPDCQQACCWTHMDFHVQSYRFQPPQAGGIMLVLRKDRKISDYESHVLDKALRILNDPLQRAMEYEDLYEQASRDTLTGLANRRVFEERSLPLLDSARRHGRPITLACMDLDRFKQVNDTHGHQVGDVVLQEIAGTIARMVRSCDLLARMGGDEFMLLMLDTPIDAARVLADRLCRAVEELDLPGIGKGAVGISIGLAEWRPECSREELIQRADEALYQAKENGRSRVSLAN